MLARLLLLGLLIPCQVLAQDTSYTVKPGDTLFSISRAVSVPLDSLRAWNGLDNAALRAGQTLRLVRSTTPPTVQDPAGPDSAQAVAIRLGDVFDAWGLTDCDCAWADTVLVTRIPPDRMPTSYRIRPGDTLFGIARAHGVSVSDIKQANGMTTTDIQVGRILVVPGSDGSLDQDGLGVLPPVSGEVSGIMYPAARQDRMLGDGSILTPERYVIGHPTLPLGSWVVLERADTGQRVPALVADRSPSPGGAFVDLAPAVATQLGLDRSTGQRLLIRTVPYERPPR